MSFWSHSIFFSLVFVPVLLSQRTIKLIGMFKVNGELKVTVAALLKQCTQVSIYIGCFIILK